MKTRLATCTRHNWTALAALTLVGLARPAAAQSQVGNQFGAPGIDHPTTSPYLNLFRTNDPAGNTGLNYQRFVRPEQQLRDYSAQLGTELNTPQRRERQRSNSLMGPDGKIQISGTGHRVFFRGAEAGGWRYIGMMGVSGGGGMGGMGMGGLGPVGGMGFGMPHRRR